MVLVLVPVLALAPVPVLALALEPVLALEPESGQVPVLAQGPRRLLPMTTPVP